MGGTADALTARRGFAAPRCHSIVLASTVPTCATYDPAYVYELHLHHRAGRAAPHVREGRRPLLLHHHVNNEDYAMPAMPTA